ncbi:MAG: [FeFe] hydrogenase H-cluster maturation GTPase HydF [Bacillota bacterium]|nr:[FeFe] hydrogenase H-cluster maturation GTPase HydF [Bacillota bacterium]
MNTTPNANRKHIAIFGNTNSGKSSLLNAIIGQEVSIVSAVKGTTTDPVTKAMELIPFGPVVFIDTAGLCDDSELGEVRMKQTKKVLQRTDFAVYVMDAENADEEAFNLAKEDFKKYSIPYVLVISKTDIVSDAVLKNLKDKYPEAVFLSVFDSESILKFKDILIEKLSTGEADETILGDLLPSGSKVILVVPVDSEAPKGRIILPQVQLIRDCLDHGIKSYVVRDLELESALVDLKDISLVVTDSQAFKYVSSVVPKNIKLTGFSVLFARYKGDIKAFVKGVKQIERLKNGSRVLISESCTHNHSHEDIGRVKIPRLLRAHTGKELDFDFRMGLDFPENLSDYDLIIHCGSCMLGKKLMQTRIDICEEAGVPITNYGVILAYLNGILDRSLEIFGL